MLALLAGALFVGMALPNAALAAPNEVEITVENDTDRVLIAKRARALSPRTGRTFGQFSPAIEHDLVGLNPRETRTVKISGKGKGLYADVTYQDRAKPAQAEVTIHTAINWSLEYIKRRSRRIKNASVPTVPTDAFANSGFPNSIWTTTDHSFLNGTSYNTPNELKASVVKPKISKGKIVARVVISENPEASANEKSKSSDPSAPAQIINSVGARLLVENATNRILTVEGAQAGLPNNWAPWETNHAPKGLAPGDKGWVAASPVGKNDKAIAMTLIYKDAASSKDHVTINATLNWNWLVVSVPQAISHLTLCPKTALPDRVFKTQAGDLDAIVTFAVKNNTIEGTVKIVELPKPPQPVVASTEAAQADPGFPLIQLAK